MWIDGSRLQAVTFKDEDTGESHMQHLFDIQPDCAGGVCWPAVKKAFGADLVEIVGMGTPPVLLEGPHGGFTIA
jgi:hypothetical protein